MKVLMRAGNLVLYAVVAIILAASLGTTIAGQPFLLSAIRSYSMYPVFTRGDMVLIKRLAPEESPQPGDIVIFKAEEGRLAADGWVIHRIVGGNATDGFITKGDNNQATDQAGGNAPIRREWIRSKAVTLGGTPIKIPWLGYVPLWLEGLADNRWLLPVVGLTILLTVAISELQPNRGRRRRASRLNPALLYFLGGLALSVILATSMLSTSQYFNLVYEVSESNRGTIMGNNVGIMQVGDEAVRPLARLSNGTILPLVATCTSHDRQISFSHNGLYLKPKQNMYVSFTVRATTPGQYESGIWVGMFFPFLPPRAIHWLGQRSFWTALAVVALVPGAPLMLYPLFDYRMRKVIILSWRRLVRKLPI